MRYKYLLIPGILFLINLVAAEGIIESADSTDLMVGNAFVLLSVGAIVVALAVIIYIIITLGGNR